MDGKRLKVESKCETRCNIVDGVDRISQLSDDIIVDILSNLTLRDAASTSALSTRWYDLWRYIPILVLDVTQYIWKIEKLKECMHSVVKKHKAKSLKKFSLSLDLGRSSLCFIPTWLEFAFSKRVEVMHLGGGIPYKSRYDDLDGLDELLKFRPGNLLKSSTLTSLHLQRFNVSGEAIKLILRDCHLLERLIIDTSIFTSDIDISGGATGLRLKHLDIRCRGGYQTMIKVAAPNLTYLGINCTEMKIFVENVPKLVEVALISGDLSILQKHNIISQLQILTLYNFVHRPLVRPTKTIPTMPKLVELDVTYFRCSKFLPTVTSLVRASPLLQTFNLKQFPGQNKESETDMEVANVEAFEHRNLKVFRFREFDIDVAHHMELVSCILDNCVALRKLIIITKQHWLPLIISQETFIEKAKQLIQPKLPTNVELQVISSI